MPSKSLEYMLVKRLRECPADLEGGRTNTASDEVCLLFICLADFTLSLDVSWLRVLLRGAPSGANLALAERDRGLFSLGLSMISGFLV